MTENTPIKAKKNYTESDGLTVILASALFLVITAVYIADGRSTGSWNPIKQKQIERVRVAKRKEANATYDRDWNKLFGPNGYADTNHDGILSLEEKIGAWQAMGFTNRLYDLQQMQNWQYRFESFPAPNLSNLESAVKSYELNQKVEK